ncbi:MAG TPA: hypothetical protein VFE33_13605 [Thermoanaerobaculia bacterium]|nr:hypothetical protein [Thermoanaerobaculia bacterium]
MPHSPEVPLPTLDRWLAVAGPCLAQSLVDEQARSRLEDTARNLPSDGLGVIEVRLAADEPQADLSVRLSRPEQACRLARQLPGSHFQALLSRWAEGEWEQVPTLWLEFDLHREAADLPLPVLCVQLPPEADPLWLADSLLPALYGRALGAAQRETVLLCAREVPSPGRLLYAFSLLSRGEEAVRLEILGLDAAGRMEYLGRLAPHAGVTAAALAPLLEGAENPHLSFDIGPTGEILPRIGLEGAFPRQPDRERRWAELLARLVDRGLCSPEKRDALLAWPGHDSFWTAPALWPVEVAGMGGFCVRFLSHLKVVGQPDRPPQAKAYLGFGYLATSSSPSACDIVKP